MKRVLVPSFIATVALASACGGGQPKDPPIATNPPGPDGSPGIGDGAGPPPGEEGVTPDEEAPVDGASPDGEGPADGEDTEAPSDDAEG